MPDTISEIKDINIHEFSDIVKEIGKKPRSFIKIEKTFKAELIFLGSFTISFKSVFIS